MDKPGVPLMNNDSNTFFTSPLFQEKLAPSYRSKKKCWLVQAQLIAQVMTKWNKTDTTNLIESNYYARVIGGFEYLY